MTQRADIERLDAAAAMHVNLAHAAALLNDEDVTRSAIEAANEALDAVEQSQKSKNQPPPAPVTRPPRTNARRARNCVWSFAAWVDS